ncbi:MAG: hypothetical protein HY059_09010 [Proteobacteria bacterium]|nr:hypothetical protein [Pseudomonadota bacterium]
MRRLAAILLAAALAAAPVQRVVAAEPEFAPGQLWSLKAASPIKVIVGKVEPWRDTVAVHVAVIDVPIPPGLPDAGGVTAIDHLPFDLAALAASVDRLLSSDTDLPSHFAVGYGLWRLAQADIYTIDVMQAVQETLEALRRAKGPPPLERRTELR